MYGYGGISIVNALPSWYGSTMAVNLKVNAEVKLGECNRLASELILTIINYFKKEYSLPEFCPEINSEVPERSGLKSSSAVAVAMIDAISNYFKIENIDVPKLASVLSLKAGVSFTGAYDDATAAYYGGISMTYNKEFKLIKLIRPSIINDEITILILIKNERPKNIDLKKLFRYKLLFKEIFSIAIKGDILTAAKLNGIAVAEILGYDTKPIEEALKSGAIAAGISGNGPSIFAIVKEGNEGPIYEILKKFGNVIITKAVDIDSKRFTFKN
jgi:shikimate kinase